MKCQKCGKLLKENEGIQFLIYLDKTFCPDCAEIILEEIINSKRESA